MMIIELYEVIVYKGVTLKSNKKNPYYLDFDKLLHRVGLTWSIQVRIMAGEFPLTRFPRD